MRRFEGSWDLRPRTSWAPGVGCGRRSVRRRHGYEMARAVLPVALVVAGCLPLAVVSLEALSDASGAAYLLETHGLVLLCKGQAWAVTAGWVPGVDYNTTHMGGLGQASQTIISAPQNNLCQCLPVASWCQAAYVHREGADGIALQSCLTCLLWPH
jgi:hypothetical protein